MIILDTSVWIEFFRGKEEYAKVASMIEEERVLALEGIFGELLQGARSKKEREILDAYWSNLPHIEEAGLWIEAGATSSEQDWIRKGVGLIDAMIVVSARKAHAKVWTLDKALRKVMSPSELF